MPETLLETKPEETEKKQIKILIAEPSSGLIDSWVYDNRKDFVMEIARLEARSNFKFGTGNTARLHVSAARESMANAAIELGYDYLFMVDDDMLIPKNCFERIFNAMQKNGAEIGAPLCTQRIQPYHPVIWRHVQTDTHDTDGEILTSKFECKFYHDFEPNEVIFPDAIGFGVVLISTDLLKRMKRPWFFSNTDIGEDIWFCLQAKMTYKAKIVCDTSIKIMHMGYPVARGEYDWIKQDKSRFEKFGSIYKNMIEYEKAHEDGVFAPGLDV